MATGVSPVAILTGKSTRYGIGVHFKISRIFSGNNLIGIYWPESINMPRLYAVTIERTSPNQKEKHTIIK